MLEFNPLDYKLLFNKPIRTHHMSAWTEHLPFAMLIVEMLRPQTIAELGTHHGVSYAAFCQAVEALHLPTRCFAIDTWGGDVHIGAYGNEVYDDFRQFNLRYESFSRLLRMTFDEALAQIPDNSVDLLHIDGMHTYDAVKHDYETWAPKMTGRGVVLFHDVAVHGRDFGVHKFWDEIRGGFPHFAFGHGNGLGVLAYGKDVAPPVKAFLSTANADPVAVCGLFQALGARVQKETENDFMIATRPPRRTLLRKVVDRIIPPGPPKK